MTGVRNQAISADKATTADTAADSHRAGGSDTAGNPVGLRPWVVCVPAG